MVKLTNRLNSTDTIKPISRLFFTECCISVLFIGDKDNPIPLPEKHKPTKRLKTSANRLSLLIKHLSLSNKKATRNESDGFFVWQLNPEGLESSFFDSCFLTCKSTQVIQFSTAYFTQFVYSDAFDER